MSATTKQDLLDHSGHSLSIYLYGDKNDPQSVTIECDDCSTVLMSIDEDDEPQQSTESHSDMMIDRMNEENNDKRENGC